MEARNVLGGVHQPGRALSIPMREEIINLYNQGYHTKDNSQHLKVTEHTLIDSCTSDKGLLQTTKRNVAGNSFLISALIPFLTSEHILSKMLLVFLPEPT